MAEVAGSKVAECLPKTLLKMLDTLCGNEVKTWSIYPDRFGISVRIRFDIGEKGSVESSSVYMQGTGLDRQHTNTTYTRKSPSQQNRDSKRKILRAKKRKVEEVEVIEENGEAEHERNNEIEDGNIIQLDTPLEISCKPPVEDTLVLNPLSPIKLEFPQNEPKCRIEHGDDIILEEDSSIDTNVQLVNEIDTLKCPNCCESLMTWDHVCDVDTQNSDTIDEDIANDSQPVLTPQDNDEDIDETATRMANTIGAIMREMLNLRQPP